MFLIDTSLSYSPPPNFVLQAQEEVKAEKAALAKAKAEAAAKEAAEKKVRTINC
jgi:hypothetical protein